MIRAASASHTKVASFAARASVMLGVVLCGPVLAQGAADPGAGPQMLPRPTAPSSGALAIPESTVVGGAGVVKPAPSAPPPEAAGGANDYPTVARADYVFACMQVNGQSRDVLEKCSCSIDVIASLLPYSGYEEAETILSIKQRGGKAMGIWEYGSAKETVKVMKRAQVEAELRCF